METNRKIATGVTTTMKNSLRQDQEKMKILGIKRQIIPRINYQKEQIQNLTAMEVPHRIKYHHHRRSSNHPSNHLK